MNVRGRDLNQLAWKQCPYGSLESSYPCPPDYSPGRQKHATDTSNPRKEKVEAEQSSRLREQREGKADQVLALDL